jgi:hypothetical protein
VTREPVRVAEALALLELAYARPERDNPAKGRRSCILRVAQIDFDSNL